MPVPSAPAAPLTALESQLPAATDPEIRTLSDLPFFLLRRHARPLLVRRCQEVGYKDYSTEQFFNAIRNLSLGLTDLGLRRGDRLALISESRPEWAIADFGCLTTGGVTVPIYPTHSASQIGYILRDSGARLAIVSDAVQAAKVAQIRDQAPALEAVIVIAPPEDGDGLPAGTLSLAGVVAAGAARLGAEPAAAAAFEAGVASQRPQDLATIVYTSGTTGEPKGVMLTHANLISNVIASRAAIGVEAGDLTLSLLPLSHVFERMVFYRYLSEGATVVFAEALTTVARDLARVRPTIMTGVPRVYEKVRATVQEKAEQSPALKRRLFHWAMSVGREWADGVLADRAPSAWLRARHAVADHLVFAKIRARTGGRLRLVISGSAALPVSVAQFFLAIGLRIVEGYGLTETSPVLTVNPIHPVRLGTVGKPLPGVELRIAEDGEILARGPNVMAGYWGKPEETAAVIVDGWFHTGDIGLFDEEGHLVITDRKKDLIVTSGGKNIAPQPIETLLRTDPLVSEAVLIGDSRKFISALIVPNFTRLEASGAAFRPPASSRDELVRHPEILGLFQTVIDRVNAELSQFERIKRFVLLPADFAIEREELTPTMKVRRKVVEARWRDVIEDLYTHRS
jgi:long-chain acyl-CoA synthetase